LPKAGDDVLVNNTWKMIYDLPGESPIYKLVRVNGILLFKNDTNLHFKAKHIFIRSGELHVGTKTHPHTGNVTITLYGEKNAETIVYDNAVEAGNKLIANVGKLYMYGQQRSRMSRLT
jgi:hypothetical protein